MYTRSLVLLFTTVCLFQQVMSNQPPRLIGFGSALFVSEDTPVGTVLGELEAQDRDDVRLDFLVRGEIANSIIYLDRVGDKKMEIKLKEQLDRETVDQYSILFEVNDAMNSIQKYTTLYVNDVNDNAPAFTNLPYRAEIAEDSQQGSFVFKVTAQDPDSGVWGLVSYSITTRQGLFDIDTLSGEVTLQESLDYETEKFFQLEIMAADGGALNSTTDLIVNVKDVQDTAPYFNQLPYLGVVREDAPVDTSILQISAVDGDRGVANPVTYSFNSGDHEYFKINSTTGVISVGKVLDREDPAVRRLFGSLEMYVLTREATANPVGPTEAEAHVTINILDVNDQVPTFSSDTYRAQVPENTQARIPLTILPYGTEILVTDYDQGENGRFELMLQKDGAPYDDFEVVPKHVLNEATVLLRVNSPAQLDYEITKTFTFQIVARETDTAEKHESRATVELIVMDMNDNWPAFNLSEYFATITENAVKNTVVTKVTAHDEDSGPFGEVTYSLRGSSTNLFRINSTTGEISVAVDADIDLTLLDREKLDTHYLIVEAVDQGGLRSSTQLQVTLGDVNDNPPTVARPQYEGFVQENSDKLERDVIIQATDLDLPPNNKLSYRIIDGNLNNKFDIDRTTGRLTVLSPIDFETMEPAQNGIYTLVVQIDDSGTPTLSATVTVVVTVEDVNDEVPYFDTPVYEAIIAENSPAGTTVASVSAKDDDGTSPNKDVIYRIEGGARDKFRMEAEQGVITVETGADLDRDRYGGYYRLTVLAIDRGTPPLTATATVNVTITDVNNKLPAFLPDSRTVTVAEDAARGASVFTYTATDLDHDAELRYGLLVEQVSGEDEDKRPVLDTGYLETLFGIHASNGTVYVLEELDRERVEEVTVTVHVEDLKAQEPPLQTATAKLTILLSDVNDNAPEFLPSATYRARISEASQPGIEVKQVLATDRDKTSGTVNYYMVHDTGGESDAFEITDSNRQTGLITLRTQVDHERTERINLTVRAEDQGTPALTSLAQVLVDIEDVNDNSPEWDQLEERVSVWENASVGTLVTMVMATDIDSGQFGQVTYHMTGGSDTKFKISLDGGEIRVVGSFDRELESEYRITIEARDNKGSLLSEQRKTPGYITVTVKDVNDFTPQFEQTRYDVTSLQENARLGAQVVIVRAVDKDADDNGAVEYVVDKNAGNASGLFEVGRESGVVSVNKSLRGSVGWYHFVIIGQDKGSPSLANRTDVFVYVEDVNDHKPEINKPKENATIYITENVPVGYWVTQVVASDKDEGVNGQVRYMFVKNPSNAKQDWLKFNLHETAGNITTAVPIDREQQQTFYLEVRAYDLGKPSYDDRRTVTIEARDVDDNPPRFDRDKYMPPYEVEVVEERDNLLVERINIADDPDTGNNSVICYYIIACIMPSNQHANGFGDISLKIRSITNEVDWKKMCCFYVEFETESANKPADLVWMGDSGQEPHRDQFFLNKTTGELKLRSKLDREKVPFVDLVVKASDDCWSGRIEKLETQNNPFNVSDPSQLWVKVKVIDVNDNPPVFTRKWFTAGVTRDTDFAEPVIFFNEYVHDPDEAVNAQLTYAIKPPIRITEPLKIQLQQRNEKVPFTLGATDGTLRTNIYFQQNMQGYFEFEVVVNDSNAKHSDSANVSIYLLNEEQRAKVILRGNTEYVGQFKSTFAAFISNITGTIINVDKIRTHRDINGKPDEWKVDMFIHAIDPRSGEVLDSKVLVDIVDQNSHSLIYLFNKYNVIEIVPAVEPAAVSDLEQDLQFSLIFVAAALGILLIIVIIIFIACRKKYKRKLKAATAMAFENHQNGTIGSRDSGLNHLEMPGTNLHTYEGSNPIWLEQCENGWPKEPDTESKESRNSIDENALEARHPQGNHYDEQEMSLEMYNDEYDDFNKMPGTKFLDADLYLQAALNEHNATKTPANDLNQANGKKPGSEKPVQANGQPPNLNPPHTDFVYDNLTFNPDGFNTREVDGLQTTDI